MGFDASKVVAPLDWDFTAFEGGKGVIPEPTDKQIDTFFQDLIKMSKTLMEKAGIENAGEVSPEELLLTMADMPEGTPGVGVMAMLDEMAKIFAKLCQNKPSATQIKKLPMRIRMRFFVWLATELRPEDFGAASKPNLRVVRGA